MLKVYCYSRCTTCKKALKWLDDHGIAYTAADIKSEHPDEETLRRYYAVSGLPLKRFFNTSGMLYRSLNIKDRLPAMSDEEAYELLATDGMLVKRPLLITDDAVLPGFKEADWAKALKNVAAARAAVKILRINNYFTGIANWVME